MKKEILLAAGSFMVAIAILFCIAIIMGYKATGDQCGSAAVVGFIGLLFLLAGSGTMSTQD